MKIKGLSLSCLLIFITSLLMACKPESLPAKSPAQVTSNQSSASSKSGWEAEWEKTIETAKKEGRLLVMATGGKELGTAWNRVFKEKFGIEAEMIAGTGNELSQKILAERRAGLYLADVYAGGTTTSLTSLKPTGALDKLDPVLFLPEVLDEKAWMRKKIEWADADHTVLAFSIYTRNPLAINTTLVRKGEVRSLYDLLEPKWKGKISMNDPTIQGGGFSLFQVYAKHLGLEFWERLAKQEILLSRDRRQFMWWLANGKVAVAIAPNNASFTELKEAGAPLEFLTPEEGTYLSTGNGSVSILNRAPHPNAARVFINWILTREGQAIFSRSMGVPSARSDVPVDHLSPDMVWSPTGKYIAEDFSEEAMAGKTQSLELAIKVFGPYVGK